ncbi:hypothetical protein HKX42_05785 [Salinisphaera sp. USBA-960]|nr:hypothetical protein [Salifodinibacter halophilus]NNC26382.1 hypothetical protein [Salifodinibacter halophilus]
MSDQRSSSQGSTKTGQWDQVALFWAFVGIPLAWGIIETFIKAAQIFY